MRNYKWHLSMHDGAQSETGTVRANSLDEATDLALVDAFGSLEHVELPDKREPGRVHWAGQLEGSTTLTVEPAGSKRQAATKKNLSRFWVRAILPAPIVVDADGEPLDDFLWKPYVPIHGGPGQWWFTGDYVRGRISKPVVIGILDVDDEGSIVKAVEKMFGRGVVVESAQPREPTWEPASTINGVNGYPKEGDRIAARVIKTTSTKTTKATSAKETDARLSKKELDDLERSLGLGKRKGSAE
jgi:hypothetical protein